jgi:membrane-associated phospholipid phosphatase
MSNYEAPAGSGPAAPLPATPAEPQESPPARVGTVVWGLIVLALAALIIISRLGLVALNGTYVLIGLMIGAGAALVIGGLLSARGRDKESRTRKS